MTTQLLTILYKELNLPKKLKGTLSKCLRIEIPVEVKKVDINTIIIHMFCGASNQIEDNQIK